MTFYDAINEVNSHDNTYDETSGTMQTFSVIELIEDLQKEYAPTIEMNKEQKRILDNYREPNLYDGDYAFNAFYDDTHGRRLSLRDTDFFDNITEKQLMQAWLYPETIKVVDK